MRAAVTATNSPGSDVAEAKLQAALKVLCKPAYPS